MYNRAAIKRLLNFIKKYDGKVDKPNLSRLTKEEFSLVKDRSVYYCDDFAIRFCHAASKNMSNTVLSLSSLQKFDKLPFLVCIITPCENVMLLANTTCLSKISHSLHQLRVDNIKGSFNGSDILRCVADFDNEPKNFENIFMLHENFTFEENLERLVEKTNSILPTGKRFEPNEEQISNIISAPLRAKNFLESDEYQDLKSDLDNRAEANQKEIAVAAFIENVNIRGRIIEYLITSKGDLLKKQIIDCLHNKKPLPQFKTEDNLGDFFKSYPNYDTQTEIKTKVLFLSSNPKAYNIDKLLRFLSDEKSIYMVYIVGINDSGRIKAALCSVFDRVLLEGTVFLKHWAGRNSRGVTQFYGESLVSILKNTKNFIDIESSNKHIQDMLNI